MKLPIYLVFGMRPVIFEPTPDGGMDIRAYDWESGDFVRDLDYLPRYFNGDPEMEVVSKEEFDRRVKKLRRKWRKW